MMDVRTIQCPRCPAWAIARPTGQILATDPPQTVMEWWCGCGFRTPAEPERGNVADEQTYATWRVVQWPREHPKEMARLAKARARRRWWHFWA